MLPYFDRWMKHFPDFKTLAGSKEAAVLKLWEGLGYYSRARNLHKLAKDLDEMGTIPEEPEAWQQFKGIGSYTAAAITSIAFGHPSACIDGNVIRILARLTADDTVFKDNNQATKRFIPLAMELLDVKNPGQHNEAMMELGATVCTKSNPKCSLCPFASACKARGTQPERFPNKAARIVKKETIHRAWIIQDACLLLHRAKGNCKRLANMLELPRLDHLDESAEKLSDKGLSPITTKQRGISNSRIKEPIWKLEKNCNLNHPELEWVALNDLDEVTLSGPHKRWIRELIKDRQLSLL